MNTVRVDVSVLPKNFQSLDIKLCRGTYVNAVSSVTGVEVSGIVSVTNLVEVATSGEMVNEIVFGATDFHVVFVLVQVTVLVVKLFATSSRQNFCPLYL